MVSEKSMMIMPQWLKVNILKSIIPANIYDRVRFCNNESSTIGTVSTSISELTPKLLPKFSYAARFFSHQTTQTISIRLSLRCTSKDSMCREFKVIDFLPLDLVMEQRFRRAKAPIDYTIPRSLAWTQEIFLVL